MNAFQSGTAAAPAGSAPAPRPVPGDRWARRFGRALLRPFRPVDEVADAIALGARLQRTASTGRRILLDDLGTGADATVVTALVARALAHLRHDRVLAVDATGREPSLAERLGVDEPDDLAGADTTGFASVCDSLGEVNARLWTVRADPGQAGTYMSGLLPISRFFGVTLVVGASDGAFTEAVAEGAHARVRVVRSTRQAALGVGRELDELVGRGGWDEAGRTVVVLFDESPREDPSFDAVRTARVIAGSGAGAIVLPHDRHLAQGAAVRPKLIGEVTHRTVQTVAAEALERAIGGGPSARTGAEGGE